jgi:serine phosphatase RsbU (regulator of sigma subunit)/ligand-binding sensor domain-containing protein
MNRFLLLSLLFISAYFTSGQIYNLTKYTQDDGLSSEYIYDISQDSLGFLHIATDDGLIGYQGTKFERYDTTHGLTDNKLSCLSVNYKGAVIIGHSQNGISVKTRNQFTKIRDSEKIEGPVTTLLCDSHVIYFGTRAGKLGIVKHNTINWEELNGVSFINKMIKLNGNILLATDNGLYTLIKSNKPRLIKVLEGQFITGIYYLENNNILLTTDKGEATIYKTDGKEGLFLQKLGTIQLPENPSIRSVIKAKKNKLIFGTWGKGLYTCSYNPVNFQFSNLENISLTNGLENPFITALFNDFNDNVWIGTFGGGLYKYSNNHFRVLNKASGLPSDRITSVFIDRNLTFIGLENGFGVMKNDIVDSCVFYTSNNKFLNDKVNSFGKLNNTDYLIATENNGIILFNSTYHVFTNFSKKLGLVNFPKTVNHIFSAGDSLTYISTIDGLYIYRQKTHQIKKLTTNEGLPHNNIHRIFLDSKKRVWLIAPKSSPGMLENDSVTLFKDLPNFKSFNVTSICEGRPNEIFIATNGDGLYKEQHGKVKQYGVANGLGSNYVMGVIYIKEKNCILCTHPNGLSVLNLANDSIKHYTNKTALKAYENTINSVAYKNQTVYFGTQQGLGIYRLNEENECTLAPKNTFLRLKLNNLIYPLTDSVITLPYNEYDIRFEFIGIELSNPQEVVYEYCLSGLENTFKTSKESNVEYFKIKDGTYIFILNSKNESGIKSIDKPIYKKWWFLLLLFLMCVGAVYLIIKLRTKKLLADNLLLEKKVNEKTADIANINAILKEKNHNITSSIDYAKRIQSVMLPPKSEMTEHLDLFIFYEPRDIVSGDFYWYHKTEKYIYIAAVDCTGHGVPGAFMSLLGTTFLNQIMLELEAPMPSLILTELDSKIINSLRQKSKYDYNSDGMDIALLRINRETRELVFSGAGRPLFFTRKNELKELSPNIFSIGGFHEGVAKKFKDEITSYDEGDNLYMFSDGLTDQFGGEQGKRFSTKKLRTFLSQIYTEPTSVQLKAIKDEFYNWKGTADQLDDVLIIGIKLK